MIKNVYFYGKKQLDFNNKNAIIKAQIYIFNWGTAKLRSQNMLQKACRQKQRSDFSAYVQNQKDHQRHRFSADDRIKPPGSYQCCGSADKR